MYTEFSPIVGNTHSQPAFLCESDCEINPKFYNGCFGKLT